MHQITGDPSNTAKDIFGWLGWAYGGWMWSVEEKEGGSFVVKLLEAAADFGQYGFVIMPGWASVSELKRKVLFAGGEILERCGQIRGAKRGGAFITNMEGADKKFKRKIR